MPQPFTYAQARQNRVFLDILGRTGNVRLSAREAGVKYGTIQHRRAAHAGFAQEWEAAVAVAHARFHLAGGKRGPEPQRDEGRGRTTLRQAQDERFLDPSTPLRGACARNERGRGGKKKRDPRFRGNDGGRGRGCAADRLRTSGGEAVVVRTRNGTLQMRFAHPDKLTKAAEQAFLTALSATANIRLAAAAAGASPAAFYRRRRQNPAFAREMSLALEIGYDRLECAAVERACRPEEDCGDDRLWRQHIGDNPLPPMSVTQAIQLLAMHRRTCRLGWEHRERRYEVASPAEVRSALRGALATEIRGARYQATGSWRLAGEEAPPPLPPLELVTGWSRADPAKEPHHPGVALFGGWRIEDMRASLRSGTSKAARRKMAGEARAGSGSG